MNRESFLYVVVFTFLVAFGEQLLHARHQSVIGDFDDDIDEFLLEIGRKALRDIQGFDGVSNVFGGHADSFQRAVNRFELVYRMHSKMHYLCMKRPVTAEEILCGVRREY